MELVHQELVCHRTARLRSFVDETRRYIYNRCLDDGVSLASVDCFCHDLFVCMNRRSSDFGFVELLRMLNSKDFLEEIFLRYKFAFN